MTDDKWGNEETNVIDPNKLDDYTPRAFLMDLKDSNRILLTRKRFIIGRGESCDLVVEDDNVSRIHCAVVDASVNFILEDMDSTNGTFCRNVRIKKTILKTGDIFSLGDSQYSFHRLNEL